MNNRELITELSTTLNLSAEETKKMLNNFTEELCDQFDKGCDVAIHGFGTFELKKHNERIIVNPGTDKRMLVPPKLLLSFKLSPTIKNKLKQD